MDSSLRWNDVRRLIAVSGYGQQSAFVPPLTPVLVSVMVAQCASSA